MRLVALLAWMAPLLVLGAASVHAETRGVYALTAEKEGALKPKDAFKECDVCPEMVVVPAGRFTMGSPSNERDRHNDEAPQHTVTFDRPFAVARFHVTKDEFAAFVAETGHSPDSKCWTFDSGKWEVRL